MECPFCRTTAVSQCGNSDGEIGYQCGNGHNWHMCQAHNTNIVSGLRPPRSEGMCTCKKDQTYRHFLQPVVISGGPQPTDAEITEARKLAYDYKTIQENLSKVTEKLSILQKRIVLARELRSLYHRMTINSFDWQELMRSVDASATIKNLEAVIEDLDERINEAQIENRKWLERKRETGKGMIIVKNTFLHRYGVKLSDEMEVV